MEACIEVLPSDLSKPQENIGHNHDVSDITSKNLVLPFISATNPEHSTSKPSLLDLPYELVKNIFDSLHQCTSALFGLTCKSLYEIHFSIHGPTPLWAVESENDLYVNCVWLGIPLKALLHDWMKPKYVWDSYYATFRPREEVNCSMGMIHYMEFKNRRIKQLERYSASLVGGPYELDCPLHRITQSFGEMMLRGHTCARCWRPRV